MPELPEIETIKLQLTKVLVGKKLVKIEILKSKTVKGDINTLIGQELVGVERRGKVLLMVFQNRDKLGFHFKMTGQLILEQKSIRASKHTRVILTFDKGILYFNDQRMFGWIEINPKFVDKLGPEPWDIDEDNFVGLFKKLKKPIKVAIMDQEIISGIGNIYANDALWESGIHPDTGCAKLSEAQLIKLLKAIKKVLREGIKYGGATAGDDKYVNLEGEGGHYQEHFRVYDRKGLKCLRNDGGIIIKIALGGRGTYYCSVCQK